MWIHADSLFSALLSFCMLLTVVTTIVVIVLDNRNPVKTLSWVLVLIFLPVVGLVLYFFFGQDRRKERLINKKGYAQLMKYPIACYQQHKELPCPEEYSPLIQFFRHANGALPFDGNEVCVYTDGYGMIADLLRTISGARHHIHLQSYIFEDDAIGRLVRDALADKARKGVEVRVLYDDVGCWNVSHRFYDEMLSMGIEVRPFLKVRFPRFTGKVNYRNHRKLAIIDGKTGFIGGMNIANRYVKGLSWGTWRDTHLKIEGRGVYGLQTAFLTDWYATDYSLITSSRYYPEMGVSGDVLMQIVTSNPIGKCRNIMQGLLVTISSARKYLYIQTPYLLPSEPILLALKTASLAGVDVRIMIPQKADTKLVHYASLSYIDELLEAGVNIYMYKKGFLHAKLLVSDDVLSTVGSTNMDFRSFEHNFEANAFMYDRCVAVTLKNTFISDQKNALSLSVKNWRKRSWYQKSLESVIRLFAPLL